MKQLLLNFPLKSINFKFVFTPKIGLLERTIGVVIFDPLQPQKLLCVNMANFNVCSVIWLLLLWTPVFVWSMVK